MAIEIEKLKAEILNILPQPTRKFKGMLICGELPEITIKLSNKGLNVSVYSAQWSGPHKLRIKPQEHYTTDWDSLPCNFDEAINLIRQKIESAVRLRLSTCITCRLCKKTTPPEYRWYRYNEEICQSCASEKFGVVY